MLSLGLPGFDALPTFGDARCIPHDAVPVAGQQRIVAKSLHFICEIVAPKKTLIRELSAYNYQENNLLSQRAIEAYLTGITASERWQQAKSQAGAFTACKAILEEQVRWPNDPEDYEGCSEPDALAAELRRAALARHKQHVANVHRQYGRDVGLGVKAWHEQTTVCPDRCVAQDLSAGKCLASHGIQRIFRCAVHSLQLCHRRARSRTGATHEEFEKKAFQTNSHRLEQRLSSLGMLRRLSDACAYVQNPLTRGQS